MARCRWYCIDGDGFWLMENIGRADARTPPHPPPPQPQSHVQGFQLLDPPSCAKPNQSSYFQSPTEKTTRRRNRWHLIARQLINTRALAQRQHLLKSRPCCRARPPPCILSITGQHLKELTWSQNKGFQLDTESSIPQKGNCHLPQSQPPTEQRNFNLQWRSM
jgi:hypothetical protein